jgi:hypothetical protein
LDADTAFRAQVTITMSAMAYRQGPRPLLGRPSYEGSTNLPEAATGSATIQADLEIQFAGQIAHYKQVAF